MATLSAAPPLHHHMSAFPSTPPRKAPSPQPKFYVLVDGQLVPSAGPGQPPPPHATPNNSRPVAPTTPSPAPDPPALDLFGFPLGNSSGDSDAANFDDLLNFPLGDLFNSTFSDPQLPSTSYAPFSQSVPASAQTTVVPVDPTSMATLRPLPNPTSSLPLPSPSTSSASSSSPPDMSAYSWSHSGQQMHLQQAPRSGPGPIRTARPPPPSRRHTLQAPVPPNRQHLQPQQNHGHYQQQYNGRAPPGEAELVTRKQPASQQGNLQRSGPKPTFSGPQIARHHPHPHPTPLQHQQQQPPMMPTQRNLHPNNAYIHPNQHQPPVQTSSPSSSSQSQISLLEALAALDTVDQFLTSQNGTGEFDGGMATQASSRAIGELRGRIRSKLVGTGQLSA